MRSIEVVTTSRTDCDAYRPLLKAFHADPDIGEVICLGMPLFSEFGLGVCSIENDGLENRRTGGDAAFIR